jgi:hypothetical protein
LKYLKYIFEFFEFIFELCVKPGCTTLEGLKNTKIVMNEANEATKASRAADLTGKIMRKNSSKDDKNDESINKKKSNEISSKTGGL